ncbi:hypothetical protein B0H10DRAFT_1941805 [Mycena sp. CBHHK59/15]|nr:hypothetical protein B0H10DRAFT_1941805 [Mycena sp. CBHHK59/15]
MQIMRNGVEYCQEPPFSSGRNRMDTTFANLEVEAATPSSVSVRSNCELFEDNDPVFGGFNKVPSDYSDDMDNHPTLPQNIGMASWLPREDDRMEVVQMQRPHDLKMYDSPWDEDLGPDLT